MRCVKGSWRIPVNEQQPGRRKYKRLLASASSEPPVQMGWPPPGPQLAAARPSPRGRSHHAGRSRQFAGIPDRIWPPRGQATASPAAGPLPRLAGATRRRSASRKARQPAPACAGAPVPKSDTRGTEAMRCGAFENEGRKSGVASRGRGAANRSDVRFCPRAAPQSSAWLGSGRRSR